MIFRARIAIEDWLTQEPVAIVKLPSATEEIQRKADELKLELGPRYLCHEKNRVKRLDGKTFGPRSKLRKVV